MNSKPNMLACLPEHWIHTHTHAHTRAHKHMHTLSQTPHTNMDLHTHTLPRCVTGLCSGSQAFGGFYSLDLGNPRQQVNVLVYDSVCFDCSTTGPTCSEKTVSANCVCVCLCVGVCV